MEKTLLQRAQEIEVKKIENHPELTDQHLELAFAFLRGEIRAKQVYSTIGGGPSTVQAFANRCLMHAFRTGMLIEKK